MSSGRPWNVSISNSESKDTNRRVANTFCLGFPKRTCQKSQKFPVTNIAKFPRNPKLFGYISSISRVKIIFNLE